MDLLQLQELIKRDPAAYREDFLIQQRHFLSQLQIFQLKPTDEHGEFSKLINFISHVAPCYPKDVQDFPTQIASLLEQQGKLLEAQLRKSLVQSLIMLRNRNVITPTSLLSLFFKMFRIPDKKLREMLYKHIVNDITRINEKKRDEKVNRTLQNFMYTMLQDPAPLAAQKSMEVMIELFRKGIWKDSKSVNVISQGVFSKESKLMVLAIQFFLNPKAENDPDEEDKEYRRTRRDIIKLYGHGAVKKTNKRKKKLREAVRALAKDRKNELDKRVDDRRSYNYAAMVMINDPQGYAEKVYQVLKRCNDKFEVRIMLMNFLARLISSQQLLVLDFYSYMQKYMQPSQQYVTQLMAIVAQSCHPLVTPDAIEPLIMAIANQFVTDRRPPEALAIGMNTIREICLRCPLAMNGTLLKDLISYKIHKDKGVSMAAKSLLTLFRVINPSILPKKWLGKETDAKSKPKAYGAVEIRDHIEGTELLEQYDSLMSDEEGGEGDEEWMSLSDEEDGEEDFRSRSVSDDEDEDAANGDEMQVDGDDDEEGVMIIEEDDGEDEEEGEGEDTDSDEEHVLEGEPDVGEGFAFEDMSADSDEEDFEGNGDGDSISSKSVTNASSSSRIEAVRLLDDDDFERLQMLKKHKRELDGFTEQKNAKKRARNAITQVEDALDADVDPDELEGFRRKQKMDKLARVRALRDSRAEIKESRGDRRVEQKSRAKTNKAKAKATKFFKMVQYSERVQAKTHSSAHTKNTRRTKHIDHNKKMNKSQKAKILKR